MKRIVFVISLFLTLQLGAQDQNRILQLRHQLELLATENAELNENLKLDINVSNIDLKNFLVAVSKVHQLNLTVANDVPNTSIVNNFSNVTVSDLLVFLCKEYDLDLEFTGNIIAVKRYVAPMPEVKERVIPIAYDPMTGNVTMDLQQDPVSKVFRKIMDISGKNLLFGNDMGNLGLTVYLNNVPFEIAMEKMATVNQLEHSISKDGFHLFKKMSQENAPMGTVRRSSYGRVGYEIVDSLNRVLNVQFNNTSIASIIHGISEDLGLDVYTATPLEQAGNVSFTAKEIAYDALLRYIFEGHQKASAVPVDQGNANDARNRAGGQRPSAPVMPVNFTFKKEGNIYFFGTADQLSVRDVEIIQMMHRSVELLSDPSSYSGNRQAGRTSSGSINYYGNQSNGNLGQSNLNSRRNVNTNRSNFGGSQSDIEALVGILPDEITNDLDIRVDFELNSFLVSGPAAKI
ncbi:MAG: hypothetical protein AB3N16_09765, partial [Flavobacteriaceae bacterium]